MTKKHAIYDNPSGYGHGGLGYHTSLDELAAPRQQPQVPSWLPWAGLAGAGLLGYAGLRGLRGGVKRLFQRTPKPAGPIDMDMHLLGKLDPKIQRMGSDATENLAAQQRRMAQEEFAKKSSVIAALGRIARGE